MEQIFLFFRDSTLGLSEHGCEQGGEEHALLKGQPTGYLFSIICQALLKWLDFSVHILQELRGSEVTVLFLLPKTSMYLKTKVQEPLRAGDRDSWSS